MTNSRFAWRRGLLRLGAALWLAVGLLHSGPGMVGSQASPPPTEAAASVYLPLALPSPPPTSGIQTHGRGYVPPPVNLSHLTGNWRLGPELASLPTSWDWREQDAVTHVQDQGACGACYAFSTLASFESQLLIAGEGSYDLSEMHAAHCCYEALHTSNAGGCEGGNIWMVTNLYSAQGAALEACDPWDAGDETCKGSCPLTKTVTDMWVLAGSSVPPTETLKSWLRNYGPLYVAMDAGGYDAWGIEFSSYDGSYTLYNTDNDDPNHAVLLVGWDDSLPHDGGWGGWIVKNSWGTEWGGTCGHGSEGGYFTIAYGSAAIGTAASLIVGWQDYDPTGAVLQHDEGGAQTWVRCSGTTQPWGLVRLTPTEDGCATGVEIWTSDATTDVDLYIYDNFDGDRLSGLLWSSEDNTFDYPGYHSIAIDPPLSISSGNDVNVKVKFGNAGYDYALPADNLGPNSANQSFASQTGQVYTWTDLYSYGWDLGIRLRVAPCGATTSTPTATSTPTCTPTATMDPSQTWTPTPTPGSKLWLPLVLKESSPEPCTPTPTGTPPQPSVPALPRVGSDR